MLRKLNLVLVSVLLTMSYGFSQTGLGTLKGVVSDADSGEPFPFAKVVIKQGDLIKAGAETDFLWDHLAS